jgi:hypothetical protein
MAGSLMSGSFQTPQGRQPIQLFVLPDATVGVTVGSRPLPPDMFKPGTVIKETQTRIEKLEIFSTDKEGYYLDIFILNRSPAWDPLDLSYIIQWLLFHIPGARYEAENCFKLSPYLPHEPVTKILEAPEVPK